MKKITLLVAVLATITMNAQLFSDDFNADVIDTTTFANWDNEDIDGDGELWEVADMASYAASNAPAHPMQTNAADSDSWEGTPFNPDNFLITKDPIDLSTVSGATLTFTVGTYQTNGTFLEDKYAVYMSTSNDPTDISFETPIYEAIVGDDAPSNATDGSASAATLTFDVPADLIGQSVYLTFRHFDTFDHNSVLIDDVVVEGALSVGDQNFSNFTYFMNQNNVLKITANNNFDNISIYNVLGQQTINKALNSNVELIDMSALNTGVYIANVTIDGQTKSFKVIKK